MSRLVRNAYPETGEPGALRLHYNQIRHTALPYVPITMVKSWTFRSQLQAANTPLAARAQS
ncbi:MAG TPA: hypothetical protein VLF67_03045 [Candidatus Saccharimonas sp.]|nr:hypothetical protein [Candidatus Saccharimonas sp.]